MTRSWDNYTKDAARVFLSTPVGCHTTDHISHVAEGMQFFPWADVKSHLLKFLQSENPSIREGALLGIFAHMEDSPGIVPEVAATLDVVAKDDPNREIREMARDWR